MPSYHLENTSGGRSLGQGEGKWYTPESERGEARRRGWAWLARAAVRAATRAATGPTLPLPCSVRKGAQWDCIGVGLSGCPACWSMALPPHSHPDTPLSPCTCWEEPLGFLRGWKEGSQALCKLPSLPYTGGTYSLPPHPRGHVPRPRVDA